MDASYVLGLSFKAVAPPIALLKTVISQSTSKFIDGCIASLTADDADISCDEVAFLYFG